MLHRPRGVHYGRHQKTYLSRAMTRAMALEHPIGDPHGGAAFGERNDPVSAIMSLGTMFAAGGGLTAAGFSFASMGLMSGLAFAGGALSLIGNITGNQKLMKAGMVVGLVGGVGALAESAGLFSTSGAGAGGGVGSASGADAALSASPAANPADFGAVDFAGATVDASPIAMPSPVQGELLTGLDANSVSGAFIEPGSGAFDANAALSGTAAPGSPLPAQASPAAPLNATPVDANFVPNNAGPAPVNAAAAGPMQATAAGPTPAGYQQIANTAQPGQTGANWQYFADPATGQSVAIDPAGKYFYNGEQVTGAAGGKMGLADYASKGFQGLKNAAGGMIDFAKANPGAAYMMSGAVSSAMDMLSGKNKAYIDYLESKGELDKAQADAIRYRIEQEERRRRQLNENYKNVRTNISVDPNTFQVSLNQPGLVSGAMQQPPRG